MSFSDIFCDTQDLISIDTALTNLCEAAVSVEHSENIAVIDCVGRVLAEDIKSSLDVPAYDNSAMDGFALKAADIEQGESLDLIGMALAGHPFEGTVQQGQCVRIMTGAPVPNGADAVIMQERAQVESRVDGDKVSFSVTTKAGANIRRAGEDIASGTTILAKGRKLTVADSGLLASLGIGKVKVNRKVVAAIFATGDELKTAGEGLSHGQIYESNRTTIIAMLKRMDVEVIDLGIIKDDKEKLRAAFIEANEKADVVISSGGVSVGEADYTKDILTEQGTVGFWKLAIKPGKPFACGKLSDSYFLGLPGNPVSAMVTFHQLAVPFIRRLAGQADIKPIRFNALLSEDIRKRPGRVDFQRGVFSTVDGVPSVKSTGKQGSGILSSLSKANCYIIIERERGDAKAGETVTVELFDGVLG